MSLLHVQELVNMYLNYQNSLKLQSHMSILSLLRDYKVKHILLSNSLYTVIRITDNDLCCHSSSNILHLNIKSHQDHY